MARLVIELRDRAPPHIGRGEVIDVLEDGRHLGRKTEQNVAVGKWALLDLPGRDVAELVYLKTARHDGTKDRARVLDVADLERGLLTDRLKVR